MKIFKIILKDLRVLLDYILLLLCSCGIGLLICAFPEITLLIIAIILVLGAIAGWIRSILNRAKV